MTDVPLKTVIRTSQMRNKIYKKNRHRRCRVSDFDMALKDSKKRGKSKSRGSGTPSGKKGQKYGFQGSSYMRMIQGRNGGAGTSKGVKRTGGLKRSSSHVGLSKYHTKSVSTMNKWERQRAIDEARYKRSILMERSSLRKSKSARKLLYKDIDAGRQISGSRGGRKGSGRGTNSYLIASDNVNRHHRKNCPSNDIGNAYMSQKSPLRFQTSKPNFYEFVTFNQSKSNSKVKYDFDQRYGKDCDHSYRKSFSPKLGVRNYFIPQCPI